MSDSAGAVAVGLLEMLMEHEQLAAEFKETPGPEARNWLFSNYGECVRAVLGAKERAEGRQGRGRGLGRGSVAEGGEGAGGNTGPRGGPPTLPPGDD